MLRRLFEVEWDMLEMEIQWRVTGPWGSSRILTCCVTVSLPSFQSSPAGISHVWARSDYSPLLLHVPSGDAISRGTEVIVTAGHTMFNFLSFFHSPFAVSDFGNIE